MNINKYNKTIENMTIDLEQSENIAKQKDKYVAKVGEANGELAMYETAIDSVNNLDPSVKQALRPYSIDVGIVAKDDRQYLTRLTDALRERRNDANRHLDDAKQAVTETEMAVCQIDNINTLITERKEQEKRLRGFLGFNKPFGDSRLIIDSEIPFIADMIDLTYTGVGILKGDTLRSARSLRASKSIAEIIRWAQENEVVTCSIGDIFYTKGIRSWQCAVLYRSLTHREKNKTLAIMGAPKEQIVVDKYAQLLFIPFDRHTVGEWLPKGVRDVDAELRPIDLIITDTGVAMENNTIRYNREVKANEFNPTVINI